jgi:tRNA1(Val) A37 N6-methylase TrmN6
MATINEHYTFQYVQPESYRFSHDSVFLAREIFEREKDSIGSASEILDLCAGCGIVGLDFLFHLKKEKGIEPGRCDFLEVQSLYREYFEENAKRLGLVSAELKFILSNFAEAGSERRYDLILCNPPYFRSGSGKLSPDHFKNRCRFFLDAGEDELWRALDRLLKPEGRAYVLSREFSDRLLPSALTAELAGEIRGTGLIQVRRAACA